MGLALALLSGLQLCDDCADDGDRLTVAVCLAPDLGVGGRQTDVPAGIAGTPAAGGPVVGDPPPRALGTVRAEQVTQVTGLHCVDAAAPLGCESRSGVPGPESCRKTALSPLVSRATAADRSRGRDGWWCDVRGIGMSGCQVARPGRHALTGVEEPRGAEHAHGLVYRRQSHAGAGESLRLRTAPRWCSVSKRSAAGEPGLYRRSGLRAAG